MDTLSFLKLVVPEQGDKVVVEIRGKSNVTGKPLWDNFISTSYEMMTEQALASDAKPRPIYFALAGYAPGTVDQYSGRLATNAQWVRSLWVDIDVELGSSKKYQKKSEAGAALEQFVSSVGLPSPLVVVSGGGLHVYWPLDRDYPVSEWRPVAQALKVRALEYGLKFDPTRTADAASVLRPVGTHNRKGGRERPVVAVGDECGVTSLAELSENLGAAAPQETLPFSAPALSANKAIALSQFEQITADITNVEIRPRSAEKVFDNCRQMAIARRDMQFGTDGLNAAGKAGDKVIEPIWVAGITVLNRCENAAQAVHDFSSPYPGYDFTETEEKRLRFPDAPATCSRFNELNPGGCKGCRFAGTIKSPIELGVEVVEAEAPTLVIESEAIVPVIGSGFGDVYTTEKLQRDVTLVQPGRPFKRSEDGIYVSEKSPKIDPISGEKIEGQFVYEDVKVSNHDIYPLYQTDQKTNGYSTFNIKWRIVPVKFPGLARDVLIPRKRMADEQSLLAQLAGESQFSPSGEKEGKSVVRYMRHYLSAFQAAPIQEVVGQFGWENLGGETEEDLSFVYGRTRMVRRKSADGSYYVENESVLPGVQIEGMADLFKVKGSVGGWAEAASYYEKNGTYKHILGILCGLGAPFMPFTGERSGLVVMRGPGGCGKSKVQELVAAAWGDPKSHLMMAGDATLTARMIHMGTMHHLPVLAEDIKDMPDAEISRFIMDAANGEERMRGTAKDGAITLQERRSWCTTTLVSTNIDWRGRIDAAGSNNEGQNRRLLQVDMDPMKLVDVSDGRELERLLAQNTGAVGPLLVRQWLEDPRGAQMKLDKLRELLLSEINRIGHERGSSSLINFNANEMSILLAPVVTALWVLFRLRNKMGLVTWDPLKVIETVCDIFEQGIDAMKESRVTAEVLLGDLMDEHRGKIVFNTPSGLTINLPGVNGIDLTPIRTPVQDVIGRVDSIKGEDTFSLSVAAAKKWLRTKSVSFKEFQKMLRAEGFVVESGRTVRAQLTAGCPGDTRTRTYVMKIVNFSKTMKEADNGNETTT